MSSFGTKNLFQDDKTVQRQEVSTMASNLAKLRFNIGVEQAKRNDLEKTIEEKELLEAKRKRQEAEEVLRKSNLTQAQKLNRIMQT